MYPLFYMVILALGDKLCGNAYPHNVRSAQFHRMSYIISLNKNNEFHII